MIMNNTNFWRDKRVFVTGGSGLVGSWLIDELLAQKADVVALVRDWVPRSRLMRPDVLNQCTIVRGDLSDAKVLERILNEYEITHVFHLAAQTIVTIANTAPLSTFESNIAGTWNLLEACRIYGKIRSVVVASSDKAYGDVPELPYTEDMKLCAIYPYDVSKACADMIATSYARTWGVPVAITRCGNFFGGGDLNWNRIVPGTIRAIMRGEAPSIRSDGTLIRDYIYVEDAVSAYLTLAQQLTSRPELAGEAFNFSNATQRTVLELIEDILKIIGSDLKPIIQNQASGEIKAQYLDSAKARDLLQWEPHFGLDEGLIRTVKWYKEFFKDNDNL